MPPDFTSPHFTSPLSRFWSAAERLVGPETVVAQWRALVGASAAAWAFDAGVLRDTGRLAEVFPRLRDDGSEDGAPYDVVMHDAEADDYEGVSEEERPSITLRAADLVMFELDRRQLSFLLADALGLDPAYAPVTDLPDNCWRVGGRNLPGTAVETSIYMALTEDPDDLIAWAARVALLHGEGSPWLLLASNRSARRAWRTAAGAQDVNVVAVSDVVDLDESTGTMFATVDLVMVLSRLAPQTTATPTRPDGAYPPTTVVYQGKVHALGDVLKPGEAAFLNVALRQDSVPLSRLFKKPDGLFGTGAKLPRDRVRHAATKALHHLNAKLETGKPAVPVRFALVRGASAVTRTPLASIP